MTFLARTLSLMLCFIGTVAASADVTVEGRFEQRTDRESIEILGGAVCFYPNEKSAGLFTRRPYDLRLPWFCFTNTARAKQLLVKSSTEDNAAACGVTGSATVRVANYAAYSGQGSGFDTALLQAVVRSTKARALPCE
jgi:hypothetical protein